MSDRPLGRRPPTDFLHVEKYGLTAATIPDKPTPVIAGANWYSAFDNPIWDERGKFWIVGQNPNEFGLIRGGHCFCFKPDVITDTDAWWAWFDQGQDGACVGFATARMMTMLNRRRYAGQEIYETARRDFDEWEGENYDGTSVRAGLDVIRERGPMRVRAGRVTGPYAGDGIERNRWAESVLDIIAAMHSPRYSELGRLPFVNSWGKSYPHVTWMPLDTLDRLLREDGECAVVTDR